MTAKTNSERQEALRRRREAAGLKEVRGQWAHPDDHKRIRAYVAKLNKAREKADAADQR